MTNPQNKLANVAGSEDGLGPTEASLHKEHPLRKKAYHAFHNAKQRCVNKKNPDYPTYGGQGIKFQYNSFDEFLADPGLPKSSALTLDRFDPHGHYEPGNLRWVNNHVQSANKKAGQYGSLASLSAMTQHYQKKARAPEERRAIADLWTAMLKAATRGYFTTSDIKLLEQVGPIPGLLRAGWDVGQVPDLAAPAAHFHLPSLTSPGASVRLVGGPINQGAERFIKGTLKDFGRLDPRENAPLSIVDWTAKDLRGHGPGAVWVGQATEDMLLGGGVEGWMFAIASSLQHRTHKPRRTSTFAPALPLLGILEELGGPWKWQETSSSVLNDEVLFLPDLQIDCGVGLDLSPLEQARLANLLEYRRRRGLKTFVGVQNIQKLSETLRVEVLGHLSVRSLDGLTITPHPTKLIADSPLRRERREDEYGFAEVLSALPVGWG